jgi:hypothetical protein
MGADVSKHVENLLVFFSMQFFFPFKIVNENLFLIDIYVTQVRTLTVQIKLQRTAMCMYVKS